MTVFFWKANEEPYGIFCQWASSPFVADGKRFPTAEHYMMYQKAMLFQDTATAAEIMRTRSPRTAKALGREVKGFSEARWKDERYNIVLQGSRLKFTQNPDIRNVLLSTKGHALCEASPFDRVWGIGYTAQNAKANAANWGENLLGKALVQIRDSFEYENEAQV